MARVALVIFGQLWWCYREAATPLFNLLVTVFLCGFCFVQTLQRTVVTLVQFPGLLNRQPGLIQFIQHVPQGVDGTFQHGGISKVEAEAFVFQQFARCFRFANAFLGQVNIIPTGKAVFVVPLAFAMTNQNQLSYSHILLLQNKHYLNDNNSHYIAAIKPQATLNPNHSENSVAV